MTEPVAVPSAEPSLVDAQGDHSHCASPQLSGDENHDDPLGKEDGELSDEAPDPTEPAPKALPQRLIAGGSAIAAASNSSEREIDRVLAEIEQENLRNAAAAVPQDIDERVFSIRSMLDRPVAQHINHDDVSEENVTENLNDTSLSDLRAAALKTLKRNGREDGEVSDPSPPPLVLDTPTKRKISERIQLVASHLDSCRRRCSPPPHCSKLKSRHDSDRKRRRSRKDRSPPETYLRSHRPRSRSHSRDRDYRRSPSRRRARRERNLRRILAETSSSANAFSAPSTETRDNERDGCLFRPRGERTEAEHISCVLGGPVSLMSMNMSPLPPPPPPPTFAPLPNMEPVSMELETTSGECTPHHVAPRNRVNSENDETNLRNMLLMQMQRNRTETPMANEPAGFGQGGQTSSAEVDGRPSSAESILPVYSSVTTPVAPRTLPKLEIHAVGDHQHYMANKSKVQRLDRRVETKIHQIETLSIEKDKLMKQLNEVIDKLALYQAEYWSASEERDKLRPLVESYEAERIRRLSDMGSIRMFTDRINGLTDQQQQQQQEANVPVTPAKPNSSSPQGQKSVSFVNEEPTSPVDNQPPPASPNESMDVQDQEEERAAPANIPVENTEEGNELEPEQEMLRLRKILLDKYKLKEVVNAVSSAPMEVNESPLQTEDHKSSEDDDGSSDEEERDSSVVPDESERIDAIKKHREHVSRVYQSMSLPVRLLPHAGIALPRDCRRQICQYELTGKCKDFTCEYKHLNDDKLSVRELMSMVLLFAPELSEDSQYEGLQKQLDVVLSWQKPGEEKMDFVRRMLRRLPQTRNDADARQANVNDETGDFDDYYSSLNIAQG